MTEFNYFDFKVNGVEVTVCTKSTAEKIKFKNCQKIPNTNYYLYGIYRNNDWIKLSGIEKLGEVDNACDMKALMLPQSKKDLMRAQKEGRYPVTLYPKNHGAVKWVFWSDIYEMAFNNIIQKLSVQKLNACMKKAPQTIKGFRTAVCGRKGKECKRIAYGLQKKFKKMV